jgi:FkbM family methyltransferase
VTLPARAYRLGGAAKQRLDRMGLGELTPVTWTVRRARRLLGDESGETVCVRAEGRILRFPRDAGNLVLGSERLTVRWLRSVVTAGMTAVDVGAHVGYFTLLFAELVGPTGRVFALEPVEANLGFLRENLEANGVANVSVLPLAAANSNGERRLHLSWLSSCHGFHEHPVRGSVAVTTVPTVRLDDELDGAVDVVKVDVEGAELDVLEGMNGILGSANALRLVVEWNPVCLRGAGHEPGALPRHLEQHGFGVSVLDELGGRVRSVRETLDAFDRGVLDPLWYGNLIASRDAADLPT